MTLPIRSTHALLKSADNLRENFVEACRHIPQKDIDERILGSDRAKVLPWMQQQGRSKLAQARTTEMKQVVNRQWSKQTQTLTTFVVAAVSAGIFGAAGQLFTFRLPSWLTIPASAAGGIGIGLVAEDRAKRTITLCRLKHSTRNQHTDLETNQAASKNEFDYEYHNAQIQLHQQVEAKKYLNKRSLTDPVAATSLILLEAAAAAYLALPAGLAFAFLAGGLPVVVILATAAALSEYIDLPKEYKLLIPEYEAELSPGSHEDESEILATRRLQGAIKFCLESAPGDRIKSRTMAEDLAEMDFYTEKQKLLQAEMIQALYECQEEYQAKKDQVESAYPLPEINRQGIGEDKFNELQKTALQARAEKIEQAQAKLEAEKLMALDKIGNTFKLEISHCQQAFDNAKERCEGLNNNGNRRTVVMS